MAILPVHQMLDRDNTLGAVQQGLQFGQQQRALGEARADRQALRDLTPRILAGDPDARAQALAIDRQAAGELDDAASREGRKLKNWYDYTNRALEASRKTGDFSAVNAALRAGAPYVSRALLGGRPAPTAWTPDMDAGWQELGAKVAMLDAPDDTTPMGFRELHMKALAAGYQPGTPEYERVMRVGVGVEGRASSAGMQTVEIKNSDGTTTTYTFDPREGKYVPFQPGVAAPAPTAPPRSLTDAEVSRGSEAVNAYISRLRASGQFTPEQINAAAEAYEADAFGGQPAFVPEATTPMTAPGVVAGTSIAPGDKTYAEEAGRQRAQFDYAPQQATAAGMTVAAQERARTDAMPEQQRIEAEGAGATQAAKDRAAAQVELEQLLPKVQGESARTVALIDGVLNHPGREAATGLSSMNPLNLVPGSPAYDFRVRLNQLKGGAFLQAFQSLKGGGAITQVEGQKAEQAIARLDAAQSEEEFITALEELRTFAAGLPVGLQRRLMAAGPRASSSEPAAGRYQIGQTITAPDGRRFRVVGGDPNDPDVEEIR